MAGTTVDVNRIERSPSQVLPHTIKFVLLCTVRNRFGEGVNKLGSIGSRVMVGRKVGVNVGTRVFVGVGGGVPVPVKGVAEDSAVLITNKSGVLVSGKENGVAVGAGELTGVGVCKNGMETGSPLQLAKRETNKEKNKNLFMRPLQ